MPGLFARSRRVSLRWATVLVAALALVVSPVTPAQAAHAASTPMGRVVLDPDDDYSHAQWGGATYTELPITPAVAQAAKAKLESLCDTRVVISRDASTFLWETPVAVRYRCGSVSEISVFKRPPIATEHTLAHFEVEDIEPAVHALSARDVEFLDYAEGSMATAGHIAQLGPARGAWFRDPDGTRSDSVRANSMAALRRSRLGALAQRLDTRSG